MHLNYNRNICARHSAAVLNQVYFFFYPSYLLHVALMTGMGAWWQMVQCNFVPSEHADSLKAKLLQERLSLDDILILEKKRKCGGGEGGGREGGGIKNLSCFKRESYFIF